MSALLKALEMYQPIQTFGNLWHRKANNESKVFNESNDYNEKFDRSEYNEKLDRNDRSEYSESSEYRVKYDQSDQWLTTTNFQTNKEVLPTNIIILQKMNWIYSTLLYNQKPTPSNLSQIEGILQQMKYSE